MLQGDATAKPFLNQWRTILARQAMQTLGHRLDSCTRFSTVFQAAAKHLSNLSSASEGIVHNKSPIHYKGDPQGSFMRCIKA